MTDAEFKKRLAGEALCAMVLLRETGSLPAEESAPALWGLWRHALDQLLRDGAEIQRQYCRYGRLDYSLASDWDEQGALRKFHVHCTRTRALLLSGTPHGPHFPGTKGVAS